MRWFFRSEKQRVFAGCAFLLASAAALAQMPANEPLLPLPASQNLDSRKVDLGGRLFRDPRMSKDNSVSCQSCHLPDHGGADPRPRSIGALGAVGGVNSPSVFNSSHNFRQLWSGAEATPTDVVNRVVKAPGVFNTSWEDVLAKLSQDTKLVQDFNQAYSDGMNARNAADAIGVYVQSLDTPSRFDAWLRGDAKAITAGEKKGYDNFKKYGCVACHSGVNVGGSMFQKFPVMGDYYKDRAAKGQPMTDADRGRFNVTKAEQDLHLFKVPSLRNVALTAPYFHDASAKTLEEAVDVMFKYQLGITPPAADKASIVKFLHTLSGSSLAQK